MFHLCALKWLSFCFMRNSWSVLFFFFCHQLPQSRFSCRSRWAAIKRRTPRAFPHRFLHCISQQNFNPAFFYPGQHQPLYHIQLLATMPITVILGSQWGKKSRSVPCFHLLFWYPAVSVRGDNAEILLTRLHSYRRRRRTSTHRTYLSARHRAFY